MSGHRRIYLDHNASSPLRPEAREAMLRVMDMPGNPSSVHAEGRALKGEIERARRSVAKLVGAETDNVFFTSGATEAANWIGRRAVRGSRHELATEHPCVFEAMRLVEKLTHESLMPLAGPLADMDGPYVLGNPLGVTEDGLADEEDLDWLLEDADECEHYVLLAMQLSNSETGVCQDIRPTSLRLHQLGGELICDAVQAVGRFPVSINATGADFMLLSAHKIGGPRGVGALVRRGTQKEIEPLHVGGGQERRQRAGTENVVGIAGFGAAAEAALRDLDDMPRIRAMRDRLEAGLRDLSAKWSLPLHIIGEGAERLPNTSCFAFEGISAQTALMALDLDGFAVSSGSACSSGKVGPSHVLKAMGVADEVAACAIRVSLGWTNVEDDIPAFLAAYEKILARSLKRAA